MREIDEAAEVVHRADPRVDAVAVDRVEAEEAVARLGRRVHLHHADAGVAELLQPPRRRRVRLQREDGVLVALPRPQEDRRRAGERVDPRRGSAGTWRRGGVRGPGRAGGRGDLRDGRRAADDAEEASAIDHAPHLRSLLRAAAATCGTRRRSGPRRRWAPARGSSASCQAPRCRSSRPRRRPACPSSPWGATPTRHAA